MKLVLCLALSFSIACSRPASKPAAKQYPLTGTVVSIDTKEHTASIDAAAIPDYMEAMKMDYPISSAGDLAALKPGEKITGTITVAEDGSYALSNIHESSAGSVGK